MDLQRVRDDYKNRNKYKRKRLMAEDPCGNSSAFQGPLEYSNLFDIAKSG